ncbi:MAG: hypothetical protein WAU41_03700 [Gaiellaceae bacterium]
MLRLAPNPMHHGAVAVARSLGRIGAQVHGVVEGARTPFARSRYCAGELRLDLGVVEADELCARLLAWAEETGRQPVLIPIDDAGAVFVADRAGDLARSFRFPRQPEGLVRRLSSKLELYRLCLEHAIPTPALHSPNGEDELSAIGETVRYPVMIKRISEWTPTRQRGPRIAIAATVDELHATFSAMRDDGAPNLLIQEYIPEGDDWLFNGYFDEQSRCLFGATGRAIRQYPLGSGPTTLGETRRNEVVRRRIVELLSTLGYRGIVDVDFRFDPRDGEYKLLDVNPRIGSTFRLFATRAGTDVARALYFDLLGESFDQADPEDGRRWVVENYDLAASLACRRAGGLSAAAWVRSFRGVRELAWASLDDPVPAAVAFATSVVTATRRVRTTRAAAQ